MKVILKRNFYAPNGFHYMKTENAHRGGTTHVHDVVGEENLPEDAVLVEGVGNDPVEEVQDAPDGMLPAQPGAPVENTGTRLADHDESLKNEQLKEAVKDEADKTLEENSARLKKAAEFRARLDNSKATAAAPASKPGRRTNKAK